MDAMWEVQVGEDVWRCTCGQSEANAEWLGKGARMEKFYSSILQFPCWLPHWLSEEARKEIANGDGMIMGHLAIYCLKSFLFSTFQWKKTGRRNAYQHQLLELVLFIKYFSQESGHREISGCSACQSCHSHALLLLFLIQFFPFHRDWFTSYRIKKLYSNCHTANICSKSQVTSYIFMELWLFKIRILDYHLILHKPP